jgi:DNA-binding CsgD family transcriptional regulator/tetratricopeptide (TPR) repeat protein
VSPLLEREVELAALDAALADACAGRGTLVLLAGEAGIGKTALVRVFASSANVPVFVGSCEPLTVPPPLGPLLDIAATLGDSIAEVTDPSAVARALLAILAANGPAVVVVEDCHWADAATLDVLRFAARRIERVRAALLVTYRDDGAADEPVRVFAGDVATAPNVVRLEPRRLSADAVGALAAKAGLDPGHLFETTGGNPFLVTESLAVRDRLPPTVRDAVLARATRLSMAARGALDVAAVIGANVDPALLASVSAADTAAIEECIGSGILVADGEQLRFRHELTRAAVEEAVSPPRRALLHGAVAETLAAAAAPDHARIAHHAAAAGLDGLVTLHAPAAAADAERAGSFREALAQRERALSAATADERTEALLAVGSVAWVADQPVRAVEVLEQVTGVPEADPVTLSRALRNLSRAFWLLDRWSDAGDASRRSVDMLAAADDPEELAIATAWLANFLALGGQAPDAADVAAEAIAAAEAVGNDEALASATISLGLARGLAGDRYGLELIRDGRELALREDLYHQQIRGYVNALAVAVIMRDHAAADALFPAARSLFEERLHLGPLDDVIQSYARSLLDRGRLDEAEALLATAPLTNRVEGMLADVLGALVTARRGDGGGRALLDPTLAAVEGAPDGFRESLVRLARAELAWLEGDEAAGRAESHAGLSLDTARRAPWIAGDLAVWGARCGSVEWSQTSPPKPFALELAGSWREAAGAWRTLGCPYDAALAALPGDDAAAREAVGALEQIGATAAARAFARARAARGLRAPRGSRRSTRADAHGLTKREREVLTLVAAGRRNAEIAAALHLSEKTVGHHVSACLRKLGASTRTEAVAIWGGAEPKMGSPSDVVPPPAP